MNPPAMKKLDICEMPLSGTTLIEASAGTGKTYTITNLYLRLLIEHNLTVEQIVVVTYTRAATAELKQRIKRRLVAAHHALHSRGSDDPVLSEIRDRCAKSRQLTQAAQRIQSAISSFDEAAIFTIHGFCQRILQDNEFEIGFSLESDLVADNSALLREIVYDFWASELYAAPAPVIRHIQGLYSGPDKLLRLVNTIANNPEVPVLTAGNAGDITKICEQADQLRLNALDVWASSQEELKTIFTSDALKQSSYKKQRVFENYFPEVEQQLNSFRPGAASKGLISAAQRFTQGKIESGTKSGKDVPKHPFFEACENLIDNLEHLDAALHAHSQGLLAKLSEHTRQALSEKQLQSRSYSYADLLDQVFQAIRGETGNALLHRVQQQYSAALIDEFQDTDPVQYEIFRTIWSGRRSLLLIGDPKQAIYGFRGADIFAYLQATRDVGDRVYTLDTNWRSDPSLVEATNSLFSRPQRPFYFDEIRFEPVKASPNATDKFKSDGGSNKAIELLYCESGEDKTLGGSDALHRVCTGIASHIVYQLTNGATISDEPVRPKDIAILTRTNRQAIAMQEALTSVGVPVVSRADISVFDTGEAAEFEQILLAMAMPSSTRRIRSALTTLPFGLSEPDIHQLEHDDEVMSRYIRHFQESNRTWQRSGFIGAFAKLLNAFESDATLLNLPHGERRRINFFHLAQLCHRYFKSLHLRPLAACQWYASMCNEIDARAATLGDESVLRPGPQLDAIEIVTIHKSKGLEYPIVYCPFLWDGVGNRRRNTKEPEATQFHDPEDRHRLKLDLGSAQLEQHRELALDDNFAERLRLAYVALTRAKHRTLLVWGPFRDSQKSTLAYLLHQPKNSKSTESPRDLWQSTVQSASRLYKVGDAAIVSQIEASLAKSNASIEINPLPSASTDQLPRNLNQVKLSLPLSAKREYPQLWRSSSFSAMLAESSERHHSDDTDNLDERADDLRNDATPVDAADVDSDSDPLPLYSLPGGIQSGLFFHDVLEHFDVHQPQREDLQEHTGKQLQNYGFEVETYIEDMTEGLWRCIHAPMQADCPSMSQLPPCDRLHEMEFVFPVGNEPDAMRWSQLRQALATDGEGTVIERYLSERELSFRPLAGYLKGFIDLIYRYDGKYYVVDFKSNRLGPKVTDFAQQHLESEMIGHDYVLQYHLYAAATHRYLKQRIPDYSYDQHFGGVQYLFIRGMGLEGSPAGTGVFLDRPPESRIERLAALLERGSHEASR